MHTFFQNYLQRVSFFFFFSFLFFFSQNHEYNRYLKKKKKNLWYYPPLYQSRSSNVQEGPVFSFRFLARFILATLSLYIYIYIIHYILYIYIYSPFTSLFIPFLLVPLFFEGQTRARRMTQREERIKRRKRSSYIELIN